MRKDDWKKGWRFGKKHMLHSFVDIQISACQNVDIQITNHQNVDIQIVDTKVTLLINLPKPNNLTYLGDKQ
jgi:hypothetical protein